MRHLRYFLAAAEAGRFSQAAENVNVSQSAMTVAIQQLEDILGSKLFERERHGVRLTVEGQRFEGHARGIVLSLRQALVELRRTETQADPVRVGVTALMLGYFMPDYLTRYVRSFPYQPIDLVELDRNEMVSALRQRRIDLAITLGADEALPNDIVYTELFSSKQQLWMSPLHSLAASKTILGLEEIASQLLIVLKSDGLDDSLKTFISDESSMFSLRFNTSSLEGLRSMISRGFGISILPDFLHRNYTLDGKRVVIRRLADSIPAVNVGLLSRASDEGTESSRMFKQFIISVCKH